MRKEVEAEWALVIGRGGEEGEGVLWKGGGGNLGGELGKVWSNEVAEGADDGTAGDLGGESVDAAR